MPTLCEARLRSLLSVRQLARKAGLSATTVHLIETGQRSPQLLTAYKLARALGIDPMAIDEVRAVHELTTGKPDRKAKKERVE